MSLTKCGCAFGNIYTEWLPYIGPYYIYIAVSDKSVLLKNLLRKLARDLHPFAVDPRACLCLININMTSQPLHEIGQNEIVSRTFLD